MATQFVEGQHTSVATSRFDAVATAHVSGSESTRELLRESVRLSAGGRVLIGIAGIVLGILAMLDFVPNTLVLVGLLSVGCGVLLSGSAVGARMRGLLRSHSDA